MCPFQIAVLSVGGIGPGVTAACLGVLRAIETRFDGVRFVGA